MCVCVCLTIFTRSGLSLFHTSLWAEFLGNCWPKVVPSHIHITGLNLKVSFSKTGCHKTKPNQIKSNQTIMLFSCFYLKEPDISIMVRVFANGLGNLGSISARVIPKTQKMVFDASLLNTQPCKVRIKGKVEQSRERSCSLPYTLV